MKTFAKFRSRQYQYQMINWQLLISDAFAEIQVEDKAASAKKEAAEAGLEAAQEKFIKGGSELRLNCLLRKARFT